MQLHKYFIPRTYKLEDFFKADVWLFSENFGQIGKNQSEMVINNAFSLQTKLVDRPLYIHNWSLLLCFTTKSFCHYYCRAHEVRQLPYFYFETWGLKEAWMQCSIKGGCWSGPIFIHWPTGCQNNPIVVSFRLPKVWKVLTKIQLTKCNLKRTILYHANYG